MLTRSLFLALAGVATASGAARATPDPWADHVVSYMPGAVNDPTYTNASLALGSPSRYIFDGDYSGATTPFNAPWQNTQIVSIGAGGSLVLSFDQPITHDPANPYHQDLIIFGNSFFQGSGDPMTSSALAGNSTHGLLEVSQDGFSWHTVPLIQPDGLFPTLGYNDVTDPFASPMGNDPTDFTRPVNPAFDPYGKTLAQLVAGYAGSGGGACIDLSTAGLTSASFLRISYVGTIGDLQIDAVSDVSPVPAPGAALIFAAFSSATAARRRR